MDLEKLKNEVVNQAKECQNLLDEKERLTKEAADIVKKNIEDILRPAIKALNSMFDTFSDAAGGCAPADFYKDDKYVYRSVSHEKGEFDFYLRFSTRGVFPTIRYWLESSYSTWSACYNGFSAYDEEYLKVFDFFGTEENTQKIVDLCLEESKHVFTAWHEYFEDKNVHLAQTVNEIKEKLSGGSTVENKEDGTVEIHLGGKTYTATLKEN